MLRADIHLGLGQLFVTAQVHVRRARRPSGLYQRCITIHANGRNAALSQGAQQPAFAAAQVQHSLRLLAKHGEQDRLVGDLAAAFDRTAAHSLNPGLGIVLPALQQGVVD